MVLVEFIARWTDFQAIQKTAEEKAQDLLNPDAGGQNHKLKVRYEYSPITFNLEDVVRFNPAHDKNHTTLFFGLDDAVVVKCPYEQFLEFYAEKLNLVVHSVLQPDDLDNKGGGVEPPMLDNPEFDQDIDL